MSWLLGATSDKLGSRRRKGEGGTNPPNPGCDPTAFGERAQAKGSFLGSSLVDWRADGGLSPHVIHLGDEVLHEHESDGIYKGC